MGSNIQSIYSLWSWVHINDGMHSKNKDITILCCIVLSMGKGQIIWALIFNRNLYTLFDLWFILKIFYAKDKDNWILYCNLLSMGEDQIFNLYTLYNLWLLPQMIVNTEIFLVQSFLYAVLAFMFTLYTFYNLWFIPKIVDMVKIKQFGL